MHHLRPLVRIAFCLAVLAVALGCESKSDDASGESGAEEKASGGEETPTALANVTSVAMRWDKTPTAFGDRHAGIVTVGVDIPDPQTGQLLSADVTCMGSGDRAFSDEATVSLGTQSSAQLELPVFTANNAIGKMAPDAVMTSQPPRCEIQLFTHEIAADAVWVQLGTWCRGSAGVKPEPCPDMKRTDTAGAKVALDELSATFVQNRRGLPWTLLAGYVMTTGEELPVDTFVQSRFTCAVKPLDDAAEGEAGPITVEDPIGAPVAALGEGESARIEKTYQLQEADPVACTWEIRRMTLPDDAGTLIAQSCVTADGVAEGACPEGE